MAATTGSQIAAVAGVIAGALARTGPGGPEGAAAAVLGAGVPAAAPPVRPPSMAKASATTIGIVNDVAINAAVRVERSMIGSGQLSMLTTGQVSVRVMPSVA